MHRVAPIHAQSMHQVRSFVGDLIAQDMGHSPRQPGPSSPLAPVKNTYAQSTRLAVLIAGGTIRLGKQRSHKQRKALMKTSESLRRNYPRLDNWLTKNIPLVKGKPKIIKALRWASGVSHVEALHILSLGTYPVIDMGHSKGAIGFFRRSKPTYIHLTTGICNRFETVDWWLPMMHRLVEATVLHEMTHFAAHHKGKTNYPGVEEGLQFEEWAYGATVSKYW
jgi:hypothetical protein